MMWSKSHTQIYQDIQLEEIWRLWSDIKTWHRWDPDIEYAKITGPFKAGSSFVFKPKGMEEVKLRLVEVEHLRKYTDHCKFFGANLYGTHEMETVPGGLQLTITIHVSGPLKWLWVKLVAQDIVNTLPEQMDALINTARADRFKNQSST